MLPAGRANYLFIESHPAAALVMKMCKCRDQQESPMSMALSDRGSFRLRREPSRASPPQHVAQTAFCGAGRSSHNEPIADYDHKAAGELVSEAHVDAVIAHLHEREIGASG
jgi:hypothetical protein